LATLDWLALAMLGASMLLGLWRGLVYEVLSVLNWVAAFVLGQWLAADVAGWLPMGESPTQLRYAAGFVVVFVAALFLGGFIAWIAKKLVEAVGLRPVDRALGGLFGLARGIVLMLALAVVVHLTAWKNAPWWKESMAAGVATAALRGMKPAVPEPFGVYLPD